MRKLTTLMMSGFLLAAVSASADADGIPRKRNRSINKSAEAPANAELLDLLRQTQQAAEAARDEARRARQQSESLDLKLEQATREIAELRQVIKNQQSTFLETHISDLKSQISDLRSQISGPKSQPTEQISDLRFQISDPKSQPTEMTAGSKSPAIPEMKSAEAKREERLATLEEQIEINTAQIKEHAQTKIESESRFRVRLFGALIVNTYLNSADSASRDLTRIASPTFVSEGRKRNNLGATMRQSKIGLAMTGPRLGNARLSAEAEFDFWGGTAVARTDGDVLGVFRMRTAFARLDWSRTSLEIGQTSPIISSRNPNSLASVWYPAMASTGNLWQWRPQIAIEHRVPLRGATELVLQGGLLPNFNETFRGETLEGDPGYEGRVALRRTLDNERQVEIGFGGYAERRQFRFGTKVNSFAFTGDWNLPLGNRVTFNGEAYYGRSINIGESSGDRIDRLYALNTLVLAPETAIRGIRSTGGWAQLTLEARSNLEFNLAYGKDDPNNEDVRAGLISTFTRFKNQAGSANFIYHLRPNFLVSLEYRRLWTDYSPGRRTNNHYNLAFGYLF